MGIGQLDQLGGLPLRLCTDIRRAGLLDDAQSGLRSMQRRDVGGAGHEAVGHLGVFLRSDLEVEWVFVRSPSGQRRLKFFGEFRLHVEVASPGTAT